MRSLSSGVDVLAFSEDFSFRPAGRGGMGGLPVAPVVVVAVVETEPKRVSRTGPEGAVAYGCERKSYCPRRPRYESVEVLLCIEPCSPVPATSRVAFLPRRLREGGKSVGLIFSRSRASRSINAPLSRYPTRVSFVEPKVVTSPGWYVNVRLRIGAGAGGVGLEVIVRTQGVTDEIEADAVWLRGGGEPVCIRKGWLVNTRGGSELFPPVEATDSSPGGNTYVGSTAPSPKLKLPCPRVCPECAPKV